MNYYIDVLKKYTVFGGRARRAEYWYFVLFNLIAGIVLFFLGAFVHPLVFLYFIYVVAMIVPSLAVSVRRLHDLGRSGWWLLLELVPIIGPIILLVWFVMDGQPGSNQYGPNPKGVEGPSAGPQTVNTAA